MNILDGKLVSKKIQDEIKKEVSTLTNKPCLLVILVGDDQASKIYVSSKEKACARVGMESKTIVLDKNVSQKEVIEKLGHNLESVVVADEWNCRTQSYVQVGDRVRVIDILGNDLVVQAHTTNYENEKVSK